MTTYNYKKVFEDTLRYFNGDILSADVWINKYALKDLEGNIYESNPDQMHRRIAKEVARIEQKYPNPLSKDEIYNLLKNFRYIIPQGSPMAGIGNNFQVSSLSNCFVIGKDSLSDSYGGIMKIDEEQVQLMKRRGGVGHDLSHIRPDGSPLRNSALSSAGIVPFMVRYSNTTKEVAQDGRRGALMLSLSIKHPDVEKFINAKLKEDEITGANISVRLDDKFMNAVINNKKYIQQFPVDAKKPVVIKKINAIELWKKIIHNAWAAAEPGILFWDTIIRESVADCYSDVGFGTVSTNPCGEVPLCAYDSCRLLAINLYSYVINPFTDKAYFDFELFIKHAEFAHRIMDDIVDLELEKINMILKKITSDPESNDIKKTEINLWKNIKQKCIEGRRTGIGITAEGDMLAGLGIRYGTEEAIDTAVRIHKCLAIEVYRSSVQLAKERGSISIFNAEKEKNNPFIMRLKKADKKLYKDMLKYGRRNIALLTIAPVGSVSLMTQTSSGIEPAFSIYYNRRRKIDSDNWEDYSVFHHKFLIWLKVNGYDVDKVFKMDDKSIENIIKKSPYHKATSHNIDWVQKVKMQGFIQKWVDHSISVTVNIPKEATEKLVNKICLSAWRAGCKGVTVYREGSRMGILSAKKKKKEAVFKDTSVPRRPRILKAEIVRFQNDNEKWIAVVGLLNNRPYEIFTGKASDDTFWVPQAITSGQIVKNKFPKKSRYDFEYKNANGIEVTIKGLSIAFNKEYWNYAKLISGVLRHGMPLPFVVHLIGTLNLGHDDYINTWKNGVVRALKKFIVNGSESIDEYCPVCEYVKGLIYEEGCLKCMSCGFFKCA